MAANALDLTPARVGRPDKSSQSAPVATLGPKPVRTGEGEEMAINPQMMFRADPELRDAITASQEGAGDRNTAAALRRLVVRGLELGPVFTRPELEQLEQVRLQLSYLGNNLNQLLRQAYMRDVATGFDWPALEHTAVELGRVRQALTKAFLGRL
mgnify:CR=1 FL=1|nr:hypothetical protein [uncultured Dongia sp.]